MLVDPYHIYNPDDPSISKTGLDQVNKSPALYYHKTVLGNDRSDSRPLIFGQAFHAAVLEPLVFEDNYAVMPAELAAMDKRRKEGKQALADWKAEQIGPNGLAKIVLTKAEGDAIAGMTAGIFANPCARSLIQRAAIVEKAFYHQHEKYENVKVRCKPDLITSDGVVCDLKSTAASLVDWHVKAAEPYRYDVQDAFYSDVLRSCGQEVSDFLFIVVEKTAPYDCAVFGLTDYDRQRAQTEVDVDIAVYSACLAAGEWPAAFGGQEKPLRRSLPGWRAERMKRLRTGGEA
ncbi:MAG: putative exodeoxyribonuclease 8 [Prokaryotic dsDNA virus sp.]|nr:MAG: putative exodeoxyribonuclease 8 [Prokaryotic dsDNA virus sp.]|tara:strand:+ start:7399 stop:8265 length:867 start_codon:yes stop_codon:yes gene_type:complete